MDNTLDYLIYGRPSGTDGDATSAGSVLAHSNGLTLEDALIFQRDIPLTAIPAERENDTRAVALMRMQLQNRPELLLLAGAWYDEAREDSPIYRYICLNSSILTQSSDLTAFAGMAITPYIPGSETPVMLPPPATWTPQRRAGYLDTLLNKLAGG